MDLNEYKFERENERLDFYPSGNSEAEVVLNALRKHEELEKYFIDLTVVSVVRSASEDARMRSGYVNNAGETVEPSPQGPIVPGRQYCLMFDLAYSKGPKAAIRRRNIRRDFVELLAAASAAAVTAEDFDANASLTEFLAATLAEEDLALPLHISARRIPLKNGGEMTLYSYSPSQR